MGESLKVLGQQTPVATILTDLYTVPSSFSAVVSSITICNQNPSTTVHFRVSIAPGGAADSVEQYLYYDLPLVNNDTFIATIGISLNMNDVVRVQSDTNNVSFNLLGVEVGTYPPPPQNLAGGDLDGYYPNPVVVALQENPVYPEMLTYYDDGYVLTWDGIDGYWKASLPSAAVEFEVTVPGGANNITSNRSVDQSPTTTPSSFQGIVNLSSDTTGVTAGADGNFVTITGGDQNVIQSDFGFIGGGIQNNIGGNSVAGYATIVGGQGNIIGYSSGLTFIGGGHLNKIGYTTACGWAFVGGGDSNDVEASYGTIGGGSTNSVGTMYSFIGAGQNNTIDSDPSNTLSENCVIGGGYTNTINTLSQGAFIGGGYNNTIDASSGYTVIGGGTTNVISAGWGTIGGGTNHTVTAQYATIVGGNTNFANGVSSVAGGFSSTSQGDYSTAFGISAYAGGNASVAMGYGATADGDQSTAFGVQTGASRQGEFAYSSCCGIVSGNESGAINADAQSSWLVYGHAQPTIGTAFVATDYTSNELSLDSTFYYSINIRIVLTAYNAAVGPATWVYEVLAHTVGGIAVIDVQSNPLAVPNGTVWNTSITVDGTTNLLHINVDPTTDSTNRINVAADIKFTQIFGFNQ